MDRILRSLMTRKEYEARVVLFDMGFGLEMPQWSADDCYREMSKLGYCWDGELEEWYEF
jgi:hypothetical protein